MVQGLSSDWIELCHENCCKRDSKKISVLAMELPESCTKKLSDQNSELLGPCGDITYNTTVIRVEHKVGLYSQYTRHVSPLQVSYEIYSMFILEKKWACYNGIYGPSALLSLRIKVAPLRTPSLSHPLDTGHHSLPRGWHWCPHLAQLIMHSRVMSYLLMSVMFMSKYHQRHSIFHHHQPDWVLSICGHYLQQSFHQSANN